MGKGEEVARKETGENGTQREKKIKKMERIGKEEERREKTKKWERERKSERGQERGRGRGRGRGTVKAEEER